MTRDLLSRNYDFLTRNNDLRASDLRLTYHIYDLRISYSDTKLVRNLINYMANCRTSMVQVYVFVYIWSAVNNH